ncbi:MAG: HlyD family efflux transporter periplasmic adaptor subunit [Chloroflexi bacterium]|nr:HlyD family efflux transporter periplasmic adaptor subunit [Chloroflexota bacterium]
MQKRQMLVGLLVLVTVVLLAGCGGAAATETVAPEDVPIVASGADNKVVAEAVIEPDRWSELRFDVGGDVVEVLVQEGDVVAEGDLLAHLETTDLERAVAQAELSLNQTQVGLDQARLRLEQLQEPADEADIRQAEHAVEQAAAALVAAQLDRTAVVNSTLTNESLEDAQELYVEMQHRYNVRVERYESGEEPDYWYVDQAQERMDDAKLNLDRIKQQGSAQLQDVRNAVAQAQQSQQEAQDALDQLLKDADPLDVAAAQKDIDAAQLDVEAAELRLEEAHSNLENAQLIAPFASVVAAVNVDPGDRVSSGEVAIVLATLDQLLARTVDLTELDVARVMEGQPVVVTVDALPNDEFQGHVIRIGLQSVDYRGDVTYPVYVELDDAVRELLWGMTAMVEIETQ